MGKPHDTCFKIFRIYLFVNAALMYTLVFFHRTCPSIVSEDMAKSYGVKKKKLGIFSSIFFYPYAVMQVFAGLLADIMDSAILIGVFQIVSAIGALICGLSKNLTVGSIGRFLVGLGCGPTYVPICRMTADWFKLDIYSNMMGIILVFGAVGAILAQYPLNNYADKYGWRAAFYGIAVLSFVLSVLLIIFGRGKPQDRGYEPVNDIKNLNNQTCGEKLRQLGVNFLIVIKNCYFWICAVYIFLKDGPFFDITGLWGGPFLSDVYGFSKSKKGLTLVASSIGLIIGGFGFPPLSKCLKTRKWIMSASLAIISVVFLVITIKGDGIPYVILFIFFMLIGALLSAVTCLIFPMISDYFEPSISGTSIGMGNFFAFLGSAIYQMISSEVIPKEGSIKDGDDEIYFEKGYRNGLWILCLVSTVIGCFVIALAKDEPKEKSQEINKNIGTSIEKIEGTTQNFNDSQKNLGVDQQNPKIFEETETQAKLPNQNPQVKLPNQNPLPQEVKVVVNEENKRN